MARTRARVKLECSHAYAKEFRRRFSAKRKRIFSPWSKYFHLILGHNMLCIHYRNVGTCSQQAAMVQQYGCRHRHGRGATQTAQRQRCLRAGTATVMLCSEAPSTSWVALMLQTLRATIFGGCKILTLATRYDRQTIVVYVACAPSCARWIILQNSLVGNTSKQWQRATSLPRGNRA